MALELRVEEPLQNPNNSVFLVDVIVLGWYFAVVNPSIIGLAIGGWGCEANREIVSFSQSVVRDVFVRVVSCVRASERRRARDRSIA